MEDLDVRILIENIKRNVNILGSIPMEHVLVNEWEEFKKIGEDLLKLSELFKRQNDLMELGIKRVK